MDLRFHLKKGDRQPPLQMIIYNPDGTRKDLSSGITGMIFRMGKPGVAVKIAAGVITAVNLAQGVVEHRWASTTTDEVGEFRGELVITYTDATTETFPKESFLVVEIHDEV